MGVRSDIGVQNVQKILFGAEKGRSHKTSQSYNRGFLVAGTTVCSLLCDILALLNNPDGC